MTEHVRKSGYMHPDEKPRFVIIVTLALVGFTVFGFGASWLIYDGLRDPAGEEAISQRQVRAEVDALPQPRLQQYPAKELAEHREWERTMTEEYDWVNRPQNKVRIPVNQAMDHLLEKGLPTRK